MKKTVLAVAMLLGLTSFSNAQDYHPFIKNSVWIMRLPEGSGFETFTVGPETDVNIDGVTYKKFIDTSFNNEEVLLREDVDNKKVYRRVGESEVLLYDFGLSVGDPVTVGSFGYTVTSIIDIPVADGTTRKKFSLNSFVASETWIEGVGNLKDPLRTGNQMPTNPSMSLRCSFQEGTNLFNFGLYDTGTPSGYPAALDAEDYDSAVIVKLSPNPFAVSATLQNSNGFSDATVRIYSQIGQLVKEIKNINGNEIQISRENLTGGVYVLQLTENGKTATQKIMITD